MYKLVKPCPEKAGVVLQCVLEQLDPCSRDHVSNNFSKAVPMTNMSFRPTLVHPARRSQANQDTYLVSSSIANALSARSCNTTMPSCRNTTMPSCRNRLGSQVVECIWPRGNACSAHAKPSVLTRYQLRSESLPGSALRLLGLGHGQSFCCYVTVTLTVNFVACSVGLQNVSNTAAGAIAHSFSHPCSSCAGPRQQKRKTCSLWKT